MFGLGLIISLGKVKFWIFPNLDNEKLGFLESFKPFYSFEYREAKGGKGKKKKKEKGASEKPHEAAGTEAGESSGSVKDTPEKATGEEEEGVGECEETKETEQTKQVAT